MARFLFTKALRGAAPMRLPAIACALALSIAPACAADGHANVSTPVAQTTTTDMGQRLEIPAHPTVIVTQSVMAPGARTPTHKHPYPRYVYVLDGTLTVVDERTGRTFEVEKGGFLAEMIDRWHHGENRGAIPLRILVIDQVAQGATTNTVTKPVR